MGASIEFTTRFFLLNTTLLFEVEGNALFLALDSQIANPLFFHSSRARSAFATNNNPINAF